MATMRAVGFLEHGGPDVLRVVDVPVPTPRPRDVLVRVHAVGVNPVDAKVRTGARPGPTGASGPTIVGWDASGVVVAVGSEATRFAPGDEVWFAGDITRPGAYAEHVAVDERIVARKPASLSHVDAAALPLTALTAWEGFFEGMGMPEPAGEGRSLLVVGGAGGTGSIAIQIAKRVAGLRTIATASRPESAQFCRAMGADHVIDHGRPMLSQLEALGIPGVDYVYSCAERLDADQVVPCLLPFGKVCTILPGVTGDLSGMFGKRGTLVFELMFTRSRTGIEPERQGAILARVATLADQGLLRTTRTRTLPWSEFRAAHEAIGSGHTIGKIVLAVPA